MIQERANPTFAMMLPYLSAVVYTVNTGGATDGIYLRGDLPFPATTPARAASTAPGRPVWVRRTGARMRAPPDASDGG